MGFAGSHLTLGACYTGETKSKPLSKRRCMLKLLMAVYTGFVILENKKEGKYEPSQASGFHRS
jgi:hypothetical protein